MNQYYVVGKPIQFTVQTQVQHGKKKCAGGGLFSRFKSDDPAPANHSVEGAEPVSFASAVPPSGGATRTVTREVRGGTSSYTKTVVTETVIGPDGQKRTVTRETVSTNQSDEMPDLMSRFGSMGFKSQSNWGASDGAKPQAIEASKKETKKPQKMKDFQDDVVKAHNKYRKLHNKVGDVKHNKELSALAQKWADHLAATSKLGHSNDVYQGKQLGENVATKWASSGADYTGQEVTDQWYSEVSKYDWRGASFSSGTGHFSQVVWKGSKEIGIGKAFGSDGRVFVVCNYHPAGNVMGQFKDNVFPASK